MLKFIDDAVSLGGRKRIDLHCMMFSFTDPEIARRLVALARDNRNVTTRLLADWSQGAAQPRRQAGQLADLALPSLQVRFKLDQPYYWDDLRQRLRWSYHLSRGLLHHKTLGVMIDGIPKMLLCGTYNWTSAADDAYEHIIVMHSDESCHRDVLTRMELEFEAIWCDGRASVSRAEAAEHFRRIKEHFVRCPSADPRQVLGIGVGQGARLDFEQSCRPTAVNNGGEEAHESNVLVAFSARRMSDQSSAAGYSEPNRRQVLFKTDDSPATVTISRLSLEVMMRAGVGEHLYLAMHGMSPRTPEFCALLEAARRGVKCRILLDRRVSFEAARRLQAYREREGLDIQIVSVGRTMHQKYLVHAEQATVLTGTANMSVDATERHSEHRLLFRQRRDLARVYLQDFRAILRRTAGR